MAWSPIRIGVALMLAGAAWVGGRAIVRALASDETKIRWRIEAAREGFGATRMDPILELLARDFRDETTGFEREDVRGALAAAFFQQKDPETKGFPFRADIDENAIVVTLDPARDGHARVQMPLIVVDTRGGNERVAWTATIDSAFEERDDGWRLVKCTHQTTSGHFRLR